MATPPTSLLVIDDHAENRFLLTRTLARKFPNCLLQERQDSEAALFALKCGVTAVVVHRAADMDALPLIESVRAADSKVPILFVSGSDRYKDKALQAGANAFLHYDEWLRVGTVVADLIAQGEADTGADIPQ